jgi:hypothetical protein
LTLYRVSKGNLRIQPIAVGPQFTDDKLMGGLETAFYGSEP